MVDFAGEAECLFPPCTFIEPLGAEAVEVTPSGVVAKLHVRLNINLKSKTCQELVSQKKRIHLSCFNYILRELEKELWSQEKACMARCEQDVIYQVMKLQSGGNLEFKSMIKYVIGRCNDVLEKHKATSEDVYLVDESFKSIVIEMLSCKQKAKSYLKWYLRDPSVSLTDIIRQFFGLFKAIA